MIEGDLVAWKDSGTMKCYVGKITGFYTDMNARRIYAADALNANILNYSFEGKGEDFLRLEQDFARHECRYIKSQFLNE